MSEASTDALILGGGPAGVSAAVTLSDGGASVLLVERTLYERGRIGESFPPALMHALAGLGLWQDFDRTEHLPSHGIRSYWGGDEPYERSFIFDAYGTGWHVDRRAFDLSLARAAERRKVKVLRATRLLSCEPAPSGGWTMQLATADRITVVSTRFVIDATGRRASLARRMGGVSTASNRLVGIYGYHVLKEEGAAADNFMLIEAARDGWWYSVPLPEGGLVLTFMTDADLRARDIMRDASCWHEQLRRAPHTAARASGYTLAEKLRLVPAHNSRMEPVWGHDWLAVGDAANAYDPLSGDGVLRALDTGRRGGAAALALLAGDDSPARTYSRELSEEFDTYLLRQKAFYSREARWRDSPFWTKRR